MKQFLVYLIISSGLSVMMMGSCKKADTSKEKITDTVKVYDTIRTTELDRPVNFSASKGVFGTKIRLTWTKIPLVNAYQIYKFDELSQEYKLLKETPDSIYEDVVVPKPLQKYFYKVRSYKNATTYSRFSDVDFGYTSASTYYKALTFGSEGYGTGQFKFTMHVEVDVNGNIYVSDEENNRVLKFNKSGAYLEEFFAGKAARGIAFFKNGNTLVTRTQSSSYALILNPTRQVVKEWGTQGSGDAQFGNIEEVALDDEENIYFVDGINHRIKKYDKDGKWLFNFGSYGFGPGQFDAPFGICYLNNKIFVTSPRNTKIQVFDKTGKYIKSWDAGAKCFAIKAKGNNLFIATEKYLIKTDENGDVREKIGENQFNYLVGVAIGPEDEIIACDVYARKIIVFRKG